MAILINAYCTLREIPALDFPHELLAARLRNDPGVPENLNGFLNYVMQLSGGEMTKVTYDVIMHIQRVQHHLSLNVEDSDLDAMSRWAWKANAILFIMPGNICDPSGAQILPVPESNQGLVPCPPDAISRKERITRELVSRGVRITGGLPPVISELEIVLPSPEEVALRCLALFTVALRAESLATGEPIPVQALLDDFSLSADSLTEKEREFLSSDDPSEQNIVNFGWRHEALFLLEWSLGLVDELPFPDSICDVPLVARLALENNNPDFIASARFRPTAEIVDALDLHYRLHWRTRQDELDRRASDTIMPGVVAERHYALNWLAGFEDADWDDVDTPT